jgi:ribosomal protein S18 acetylase RimI-like enzyme
MAETEGAAVETPQIRRAEAADAASVGRLLDDFNREYDWPSPGAEQLAERVAELLAGPGFAVLLAGGRDDASAMAGAASHAAGAAPPGGGEPVGLAVLRFRPSLWSRAQECYLAELYVVPDRRGEGLGRALLSAVLELARAEGADHIDLGTSDDDTAARGLYESFGFTNRENGPDGPLMYVYEREL